MKSLNLLLTTAVVSTLTLQATASPVFVTSADLLNHCDPLAPLPALMDELGTSAAFPADEFITAAATFTNVDACPSSSSPLIPNVVLSITNQTTLSFTDLHYVSDFGSGFTNFDGVINGFEAVRLDNVGVNRPLISEVGGVLPLVFEPGETWRVILDDWSTGSGLTAADLGSIGIPSGVLPDISSGSIVAIPVPEPASASLVAVIASALLSGVRGRQAS